ncbi:MAG: hypothetical protein WA988_16935 [Candidatus Nanopelagicales bacterium]
MRKLIFGGIGALALVSTAACSSGDPVADASASVSDAASSYCSQLSATAAATGELATLATNPNTTVDELKAQRAEVNSDLQDLKSEATNLKETQKAAVGTLTTAYEQAIQSIPADSTVSQAGQQITAATTALSAALTAVKAAGNC